MKAIPLITHIVFWLVWSDLFIVAFSICLLFLSVDFWLTKNVNGRLMVGLRWWNHIDDEGNSVWVFEALEDSQKVRLSYFEMMGFWGTIMLCPVLWLLTLLLCLVNTSIPFIGLVVIAVVMNTLNLCGFMMSAKGTRSLIKRRVKKVAVEQGSKAAVAAAASSFN